MRGKLNIKNMYVLMVILIFRKNKTSKIKKILEAINLNFDTNGTALAAVRDKIGSHGTMMWIWMC